jgi:N-acetylmuramoyl-L-alanine amidase
MYTYIDQPTYIPQKYNKIWVLDPGHGGMVNGKYDTYPSKMYDHGDFVFYEGVYNRQVVSFLAEKMRAHGLNYVVSTDSNLDISIPVRVARAKNIKRIFKHNDTVFLSFHGNAAGIEEASGIELYTSPGDTPSDPLASLFYNKLASIGWRMRHDYSDGDSDKESRFAVLMNYPDKAILFELGFFTNKEEAKKMLDPVWQDKITDCIIEGMKEAEEK